MGRHKRYASEAEKQAAYRLRKKLILVEKEAVADDKNLGTDGDLPVPVLAEPKPGKYLLGASIGVGEARESTNLAKAVRADSCGGHNPTIEALRELVRAEKEKPTTEARVRSDVVGGIYRNDFGGVISKFAWEKLQEKKRQAKEGGYTLDEYSQ